MTQTLPCLQRKPCLHGAWLMQCHAAPVGLNFCSRSVPRCMSAAFVVAADRVAMLHRPRLPYICRRALFSLHRNLPLARCLASAATGDTAGTSAQQVYVPRALMDALTAYPALSVAKFAGSGRGLVATCDISYGDTVLLEQPLLCHPSEEMIDQVCYGCLAVLGTHNQHITSPLSGRHFCSDSCMTSCEARFHALESLAMGEPSPSPSPSPRADGPHPSTSGTDDIGAPGAGSVGPLPAFEAMCAHNGERFPLMAARMAFARLTRAVRGPPHPHAPHDPSTPTSPSQGPPSSQALGASASALGSAQGSQNVTVPGQRLVVAGDPVADLSFLCFARIPQPYPEPWQQLYGALRQALEAAVQEVERQLLPQPSEHPAAGSGAPHTTSTPASTPHTSPQGQQAVARLRSELEQLTLDWFVSVLARLHINVFRVGCLIPPSASLQGGIMPGPTASGSAAYLVASLFNHSCEPNVEVVFRRNDATAAFTAARDIAKGEQLFVSYLDETLSVRKRQEHLMFAYGFKCRCQRCVEEEEDLVGGLPAV